MICRANQQEYPHLLERLGNAELLNFLNLFASQKWRTVCRKVIWQGFFYCRTTGRHQHSRFRVAARVSATNFGGFCVQNRFSTCQLCRQVSTACSVIKLIRFLSNCSVQAVAQKPTDMCWVRSSWCHHQCTNCRHAMLFRSPVNLKWWPMVNCMGEIPQFCPGDINDSKTVARNPNILLWRFLHEKTTLTNCSLTKGSRRWPQFVLFLCWCWEEKKPKRPKRWQFTKCLFWCWTIRSENGKPFLCNETHKNCITNRQNQVFQSFHFPFFCMFILMSNLQQQNKKIIQNGKKMT